MSQNIQRNSSAFYLSEISSPWREVLHLARREEIPSAYRWQFAEENQPSFSFLDSGQIYLYSYTQSMRERIILQLGSGCIFREASLFYKAQRYRISPVAMSDCIVYHFPASLLTDINFMQKYPHLITNFMHNLSTKLGAAISLVAEAVKPPPEVMVSQFLLNFKPDISQTEGISQGNIALSLGLHRSTVCRIIADLRKAGAIGKINKKEIEILDRTYLEELSDIIL